MIAAATKSLNFRRTKAEEAIKAALDAGFEVTRHLPDPNNSAYYHELEHADGRRLTISTSLGAGGRFLSADGRNRSRWTTTRLAARSLPALKRLLATSAR